MHSALFPAFRSKFIADSAWSNDAPRAEGGLPAGKEACTEPLVQMAGCPPAAAARGGGPGPAGLLRPLVLDLNALPSDEGPPSESVLKRQKFAAFEKHCSQVAEGLYVSGEAVARDRSILAQHRISHVVNCVGALYPEFFKSDGVQYKTLWLQDHPQEDITCVLYDTFDFIEAARKGATGGWAPGHLEQQQRAWQQQQQQPQPPGASAAAAAAAAAGGGAGGGRVLVHCSQGVSRSTTIAIAYLMWKTGGSYDEVYQAVRSLRGVTSPNVGFMCQLINWAKRRQRPPSRVRLYRIAPHCPDAAGYLVPKAVGPAGPSCSHPHWSAMDPRGCFVVHTPDKVYVWRGQDCMTPMLEAGLRAAAALSRYEAAPQAQVVRQGEEPVDLIAALAPACSSRCGGAAGDQGSSCCGSRPGSAAMSVEPSSSSVAAAAAARGSTGDCGSGSSDQQQLLWPGDVEMAPVAASAAPSAPGTRPTSARQQQQPEPMEADSDCCAQGAAAAAACCSSDLQQQQQQQQRSRAAAAGKAVSSNSAAAAADDAAAAAAAARVLLGVQLDPRGPTTGLSAPRGSSSSAVVTRVADYDRDFELWYHAGALTKPAAAGSSSGVAAGRGRDEAGAAAGAGAAAAIAAAAAAAAAAGSPQAESPSADARQRKNRRSDSEGRSVVPSFRQPGRLSTSSSSSPAWPAEGGAAGSAPSAAMDHSSPGEAP